MANSRVLSQLKLIHEKISELERMRLYLRVNFKNVLIIVFNCGFNLNLFKDM